MQPEIIQAFLGGVVGEKEAMGLLQIANGKPLLREVPAPGSMAEKLGMQAGFATLDLDGNALISGKNYIDKNGKKVKVLREQFGSGNILDTYYYVYLLNQDLNEERILVEGKLQKGFATKYQSDLRSAED